MLDARLINGGLSCDDRGHVKYCNDFDISNMKRFYMVGNHEKGFIRAWHGHRKEAKAVWPVSGSCLVGVVDMESEEIYKVVLTADKPQILYIPPGHFNGFKSLTENASLMFFSNASVQESMNDDIRMPWDKWNIWNPEYR